MRGLSGLLVMLCCSDAVSLLLPRPVLRAHAARRSCAIRAGFEVEALTSKDVEDMNVLNWPGLEKRSEDFEKVAFPDEMVYVYCREGSATLSADGEESVTVAAGLCAVRCTGAPAGLTLMRSSSPSSQASSS